MTQINDYQIISTLYESNRTIVNRAQDKSGKHTLIFKSLNKEYPTSNELNTLLHEYQLLKKLKNIDGIPSAYECTKINNIHTIIMKDIYGKPLKQLIQTQNFSIAQIVSMAIDIATIIGKIHAAHIIHKDITPANIVIDPTSNRINIIDYGASTQISIENPSSQIPNIHEGSFYYISPEQTGRMNRSLDYRTDYYSFGVTLYELLTKTVPFKSNDPMEMIHCHIAKQAIPPNEMNNDIPTTISNIVIKLLEKNAEDRYQSSGGIIADLLECHEQLTRLNTVSDFPLGQKDVPERFQIPQKLYGRESEINTLLDAFDRVVNSTNEIVFIGGYSGIGKTVLVKEIYKPVTRQRGYFISGKFDQFQRDIPYKAIVEAFSNLVRQLLTEQDEFLNQCIDKMLSVLGNNGQVIIDIIPDIELLIGKQPEIEELGPAEAQNRFNHVFQNFIKGFTHHDHPIVMFIDDLQWADIASLKLIQQIMNNDNKALLIIGAYRNNEVDNSHPLFHTINEIKKTDAAIHEIVLSPLNKRHTRQLIRDSLFCSKEECVYLANIVHHKTGGNPFFINEFLKNLYVEGLIKFTSSLNHIGKHSFGWEWDIKQIQEMDLSDNVVDLMSKKIIKLNKNVQNILNLAACIGNTFDLKTLSLISENNESQCINTLNDAVSEGLIVSQGTINEVKNSQEEQTFISNIQFKFSHDRVQQAAYLILNEDRRKERHYKIGQLLLKRVGKKEVDERIFDIINQLNCGIDLTFDQSDRIQLISLNLIASKRAKDSAAFEPSYRYLSIAIKLLNSNSWKDRYDLAIRIYTEAAESAFLIAKFDEMDYLIDHVLSHSKNVLDKVKVYETRIQAYMAQNYPMKGIETAYEILRLLGVRLPKNVNKAKIMQGFIRTQISIGRYHVERLIDLPSMTEPYKLAAMRIMSRVSAIAFIAYPSLYPILVFRQVKLSAKYGNAIVSPFAYAAYGSILCGIIGDIDTGYRLGKIALQLLDKTNAKSVRSKTIFVVNCLINHWKKHIKDTLPDFQHAYAEGVEVGDLEYAAWSAFLYSYSSYFMGKELTELHKEMKSYSDAISQLKQEAIFDLQEIHRQTVLNLMGKSENTIQLIGNAFNEEEKLPELLEINDKTALCHLYFNKMRLCYLFHQYHRAIDFSTFAEKYLEGVTATQTVVQFYFYDCLIRTAIYPFSDRKRQNKIIQRVRSNIKRMKKWAHFSKINHCHKHHIMQAELLRVTGNFDDSLIHYKEAITWAQKSEYINDEAIANELAAQMYLILSDWDNARLYMYRARQCYLQWGAIGVVKFLEERYYQLFEGIMGSEKNEDKNFDMVSVTKASQTISGEILLDRLLNKLMNIMIENVGAEKGMLFLEKNNKMYLEAYASSQEEKSIVLGKSIENYEEIPLSVMNFVSRTNKTIVLNDAAGDSIFVDDPYVSRLRPRSVVCIPIQRSNKNIGQIYMEHGQAPNIFTPDRMEVLNLLIGQVAISIENAKLYTSLEESEKKYRSLYENALEGIYQSGPDDQLVDANPSLAKIMGYETTEELISSKVHINNLYVHQSNYIDLMNKLNLSDQVINYETQLYKKDNYIIWVSHTVQVVRSSQEKIVGYEGTFTDITEKKEKERAERAREIAVASKEKLMDSIRYAQIIQKSLLPDKKQIKNIVPKSFILYIPKDIVGGDIYFSDVSKDYFIIAVIDCTGHGVPGAFMTMIASSSLRRIVTDENCYDPAQILQRLNFAVKSTLQQNTNKANSDDGMDACICAVNKIRNELTFSGAILPLFYTFDNEVFMIKGNRQSLGYKESKRSQLEYKFTNHIVQMKTGMAFYMATDGYKDQLGGRNLTCFGNRRFKELLKNSCHLPFDQQKEKLIDKFNEYRGDNEVQDDITVFGFGF